MSNTCKFDKTIASKVAFDMQTLAEPLLKYFNITMFGYMKIYTDNTQVSVSTHPHWLKCFFENIHSRGAYNKISSALIEGYHLWSQLVDQLGPSIMRTDFKLDHGITLVKKNKDDTAEVFSFASSPKNNGIITWYLNNLDILEIFTHSFKEKALPILKQVEADRLILPKCLPAKPNDIFHAFTDGNEKFRQSFISQVKIKRYVVNNMPKKQYLTQRELNCIARLANGESIKDIAKSLSLSPRTIETYLNNAKAKLGAKNMIEMITKIVKLAPHLIYS
jgi:DNA-binding CsgD family transcriptional regulator